MPESESYVGPSLNPEHVVAAISLAGEIFRKGVPAEKEATSWALRHAKLAKLIVNAVNNQ
jgi:hypothetical protein